MLKIFTKNDGAVSVFLSLILLPVMIVGCMTVDGARIYAAKPIISDAGEMAMNAGLAQYDFGLKDEYGFLAMEKTPESMNGELEDYFKDSLISSENYDNLIHLLEEDFRVINIEASKLYKTEVEKQQIIEYMKFRAPICIAETIADKLGQLKDTEKMAEAMEAEIEFAKANEKCEGKIKDALESLDDLNSKIEKIPSQNEMQNTLDAAYSEYTSTMSTALLMKNAVQNYSGCNTSITKDNCTWKMMESLVDAFIQDVLNINYGYPVSETTFNSYMNALYTKNTIDRAGGELLKKFDQDTELDESEKESMRSTLEGKVRKYDECVVIFTKGYPGMLQSTAKNIVNDYYNKLSEYRTNIKEAEESCKTAYDNLDKLKKAMENAQAKYQEWGVKVENLPESTQGSDSQNPKKQMQEEFNKHKDIFGNSDGDESLGKNIKNLDNLMTDIETDKLYFNEVYDILNQEKFYEQSLASADPINSQISRYNSEARSMTAGFIFSNRNAYSEVEKLLPKYVTSYEHIYISTSNVMIRIADSPFYAALKRNYGGEEDEATKKTATDRVNEMLKEALGKWGDLFTLDVEDYEWSGENLPSALYASGVSSSGCANQEVPKGDAGDKSGRENLLNEMGNRVSAAKNFIKGVDELLGKGLENLYIAEYGMQMFSYYTVDIDEGEKKSDENIMSLSGYPLTSHKGYKGEVEYILWGHPKIETNINETLGVIAGIRTLFNMFYAFTDAGIRSKVAEITSPLIGAPFIKIVVEVLCKSTLSLMETAEDIIKIKQGYDVAVVKDSSTWVTDGVLGANNTKGKYGLSYEDYLRIFMGIGTGIHKKESLSRIGDCVQVNIDDDFTQKYTMIGIESDVKIHTTFMRQINEWSKGDWDNGNSYKYTYQSILGY